MMDRSLTRDGRAWEMVDPALQTSQHNDKVMKAGEIDTHSFSSFTLFSLPVPVPTHLMIWEMGMEGKEEGKGKRNACIPNNLANCPIVSPEASIISAFSCTS